MAVDNHCLFASSPLLKIQAVLHIQYMLPMSFEDFVDRRHHYNRNSSEPKKYDTFSTGLDFKKVNVEFITLLLLVDNGVFYK